MSRVIGSLTIALLCGLLIAYLYRLTYRGTSYSTSYVQSLVAFAMITAVVIMVIGNNLARAFGLVGSMSIVRFRMAIKDTKDIVFIFFTLAIGMACGVGQHMVAVTATLFISMIILFITHINFPSPHRREYLLHFYYESDDDDDAKYIPVLARYCKKYKIVNIRAVGDTDIMEISYYVTIKHAEMSRKIISELRDVEGVSNINFFFDEE